MQRELPGPDKLPCGKTVTVRKTESKIPANFQLSDLGETVLAADSRCALVSFISSPLVVDRENRYVLFVTDPALAATAQSYEWAFSESADAPTIQTSEHGEISYRAATTGTLDLTVRILDSTNAEQASLTLAQEVLLLHSELEELVNDPEGKTPVAADPETSRELVNDVRGYIDELVPRDADDDSSLNKLIFSVAYAEAMLLPTADRVVQLEQLAFALNEGGAASFADQAEAGIGLCRVRPQVLAMFLSATPEGTDWLIPPREFPHDPEGRGPMQKELLQALAELDETRRLDLFNLLRFPKSNLKMGVQLLEAMRTQYFSGEDLPSILADEDKAKLLISQFKEGPFALA